ncbi:hypothetical protein PMI29_05410 [Pseudomonas sp. GM49]|uniref:hypothetical protein n=1 Tax=Pseudomonas sp. GM49 TaxID=1144331 RepID=UPI00026FDCD6|nr:hypothetical protein [Pseudomonas sp. GM49]EJM55375.1 hypothetical protein PMI29_05410 [Pseudomonas sp. GM49]
MTDAIKPDVESAELFTEQEIRTFSFDIRQSALLHKFAEELTAIGGPQAPGARSKASLAATELKFLFSKDQCELLDAYSDGLNSYRFSVNDDASTFVKTAYTALCQGVGEATPVEYTLTRESAMVIKDNRRALV